MSSGSKKPRRASVRKPDGEPPELEDWQLTALEAVSALGICSELVFGGGAALATLHLHHRRSKDLDFFLQRELEPGELRPLTRVLGRDGVTITEQQVGPRRSLVLARAGADFGRIDFAFYPYDPIGRRQRWRGLLVESFLDMTVNKLQAVLTRFQPRDYVDLYYLLREGPEPDIERLLGFIRAKFDVGADRLALAQRLLLAAEIRELPQMLRPVAIGDLAQYFEEQARAIVRKG